MWFDLQAVKSLETTRRLPYTSTTTHSVPVRVLCCRVASRESRAFISDFVQARDGFGANYGKQTVCAGGVSVSVYTEP